MPRRRSYKAPVDEKTIGQRLKDIRNRRGLTQAQLAELVGIEQSLVSDYERGNLRLHGALVAGFARALATSADEILGLKDDPTPPRDGKLLRRLARIEELPPAQRRAVLKILDGLLDRQGEQSPS